MAWSAGIASVACLAACASRPPASPLGGEDLAWTEGTWVDERRGAREIWWRSGDARFGFAYRYSNDGRTDGVEFLRIDGRGLTAAPRGQAVTRFATAAAAPGRARFANPAHDFPKWVSYALAGDRLTAEIGADADRAAATWRFFARGRRRGCDSSPARSAAPGTR